MKLLANLTGAAVAIFVIAPVTYMILDRDPPYVFTKTTIPPEVRQGEEYPIVFETKKLRDDCEGEGWVYREYVDAEGLIRRYDPIYRKRPPEIQSGKVTRYATVPLNFPPGITTYRGQACYPCNILQRWLHWPVCVVAPETKFTVLPAPGGITGSRSWRPGDTEISASKKAR